MKENSATAKDRLKDVRIEQGAETRTEKERRPLTPTSVAVIDQRNVQKTAETRECDARGEDGNRENGQTRIISEKKRDRFRSMVIIKAEENNCQRDQSGENRIDECDEIEGDVNDGQDVSSLA